MAAQAALEAANPDAITLELKRSEKAERAIRTDIETLTREKRDLEVGLKVLGRDGLGEQLAELEGRLSEARKWLAANHAEAAAARLLHDTLELAQREAREQVAVIT